MNIDNKIIRHYFNDKRKYKFDLNVSHLDIDPTYWYDRSDTNGKCVQILTEDISDLVKFYNDDNFYDSKSKLSKYVNERSRIERLRSKVLSCLLDKETPLESMRDLLTLLSNEIFKTIYSMAGHHNEKDLMNITLFALLNMPEYIEQDNDESISLIDAMIKSIPVVSAYKLKKYFIKKLVEEYHSYNRKRKIKNIIT